MHVKGYFGKLQNLLLRIQRAQQDLSDNWVPNSTVHQPSDLPLQGILEQQQNELVCCNE